MYEKNKLADILILLGFVLIFIIDVYIFNNHGNPNTAFFIDIFIMFILAAIVKYQEIKNIVNPTIPQTTSDNQESTDVMALNCTLCGAELKVTDKFCTNCGAPFDGNNVAVSMQPKVVVRATDFDNIYYNSEDKLLEEFIKREMVKCNVNFSNMIPQDALNRKIKLNIIFSVLLFIYISLIFFHFPILTYIIGLVILVVFYKMANIYNLMTYLKKEIKARPSEKISNIIMNVRTSLVVDKSKNLKIVLLLISIISPLIIFMNPRIMYEKSGDGYAVRFYTFGLTNYKTAVIPSEHNGKKVVSLRGNTFSNMFFLEKVTLPDTITEIRGQAFKNDRKLKDVNIPKNLEYLGGGAFYNCKSITSVILPDTLTFLGGESFYGASSLRIIKLSNNLTEIRGDTFEYCISLDSIEIPDNVTRIGGHAFYGDDYLSSVKFSPNSKLAEIGSSAFRLCPKLYSITIPDNTVVNERAFKESPTTVKYFGKETTKSNYVHSTSMYIYVGESQNIYNYSSSNAIMSGEKITLESVHKDVNNLNVFTLKFRNTTFELSYDKRSWLTDNLYVFIKDNDDYMFKYDDYLSKVFIEVYYN